MINITGLASEVQLLTGLLANVGDGGGAPHRDPRDLELRRAAR
jgi:hypothetical protein